MMFGFPNSDPYHRTYRDPYLGKQITCPLCGQTFRKGPAVCPGCETLIFGINKDNELVLLDPEQMDRSRTFLVRGYTDGRRGHGDTAFHPGDLVTLPKPREEMRMLDSSSDFYLDGVFANVYRFIMPEWDVTFTSVTRGMAMNSTTYYGPYGERLKGPYYTEESILRPGETVPAPAPAMGMMGMSMMHMMNLQPQPPASTETVQCPECGQRVPKGKFCAECGRRLEG